MKIPYKTTFSILFLLVTSYCHASIFFKAGPEVYEMRRWRDGGTKQSGCMTGLRVELERIKANAWYVGGDAFISSGWLKGRTASGRPLKSKIEDLIYEGRVGFTFQNCLRGRPFITLFGGYGQFQETNQFYPPSPIPFKFKDTFNFVVAGFLSGINFNPLLSMGINFKVRVMMNGKSKVTDDPIFDTVTLLMNDETQYRLEVPFTYQLCTPWKDLYASLIPFYEFRHFGGRQGFPFDYIDTKFSLFGARLSFAYRF